MSRFVFAGNEIIPGTVIMTADGAVTPKDDLRVILNISGGGNVTVPDGTDTTQRMELVNVSADTCSLTYKGTGGSTTASIYTNTGIRLLWVGTYWETSMSTAVTGIDDNSQPFAFNIDSLVKPDGVINLTGTDANGNPFDYGLGKLVTVADEDNYSTSEVKTTQTWIDGKPIYRKTWYKLQNSYITLPEYLETTSFTDTVDTVVTVNAVRIWNYITPNHTNPIPYYNGSIDYMQWALDNSGFGLFGGSSSALYGYTVTMFYTKTTD